MPSAFTFSEENKNTIVRNRGLDPAIWAIAPDDTIIPRLQLNQLSPPSSPTEDPLYPDPSASPGKLESLTRGAAESFLPSLASIGTAAGIGTLFGGPIGTIGGIAGALAAGYGSSYLQKKLVPQDIQEKLFLRQEDLDTNPGFSVAGQFIPSALAFNPLKGLASLPSGLKGIKTLIQNAGRTTSITPAQKSIIANLAVSEAMETGQMAAESQFGDRDLGLGEIISRLGLAAIMNEPNKRIGKGIFKFTGADDYPEIISPEAARLAAIKPYVEKVKRVEKAEQKNKSEDERIFNRLAAKQTAETLKTPTSERIEQEHKRRAFQSPEDVGLFIRSGGKERLPIITPPPTTPSIPAETAIPKKTTTEEVPPIVKSTVPKAPDLNTASKEEIDAFLKTRGIESEDSLLRSEESTLRSEIQGELKEKLTPLVPKGTNLSKIKNLPKDLQDFLQKEGEEGARRRGFKITRTPTIRDAKGNIVTGKDGLPILGSYDPNLREIKIATEVQGAETFPHETGHGFTRDLLTSARPQDPKLAIEGLEFFAKTDEQKSSIKEIKDLIAKGDSNGAVEVLNRNRQLEEDFIEVMAGKGLSRQLNRLPSIPKRQKLKAWYKEVIDHAKNRLGTANEKQVLDYFAARQATDVPFGSDFRMRGLGRDVGGSDLSQEDSFINKRNPYNKLLDELKFYKTKMQDFELEIIDKQSSNDTKGIDSTQDKELQSLIQNRDKMYKRWDDLNKILNTGPNIVRPKLQSEESYLKSEESNLKEFPLDENIPEKPNLKNLEHLYQPAETNSNPPRAFWLSPGAKIIHVRGLDFDNFHADTALEIVKLAYPRKYFDITSGRNLELEMDRMDAAVLAQDFIEKKGWVRGVRYHNSRKINLGSEDTKPVKLTKEIKNWVEDREMIDEFQVMDAERRIYEKFGELYSKESILKNVTAEVLDNAIDLLSKNLYAKGFGQTIMKETAQNSVDAVQATGRDGEITTEYNIDSREFSIEDTGTGMTPEVVARKFLIPFASGKRSTRSSDTSSGRGAFGVAKIGILGSSENFDLNTVGVDSTGRKIRTTIKATNSDWRTFVTEHMSSIDSFKYDPKITEYTFGPLKMKTEVVDPDKTTGTTLKIIIPQESLDKVHYSHYTAKSMQIWGSDLPFVKFDGEFTPSRILHEQTEVPGAIIKVKFNPAYEAKTYNPIFVANDGLYQMTIPSPSGDAMIPANMLIDVIATVGPGDFNYPFTLERDNVKGATKDYVNSIVSRIGDANRQNAVNAFEDKISGAHKFKDEKFVMLDISENIPKETMDKIVQDPFLKRLGKSSEEALAIINQTLGLKFGGPHFAKARYGGHFFGREGLAGVRIGTGKPGSEGNIYISPFDIANRTEAQIASLHDQGVEHVNPEEIFVDEYLGTILHEAAHQVSHSEGEEHAQVLDRMAAMLRKRMNTLGRLIEDAFDPNKMLGDEILDILAYVKNIDTNPGAADSFIAGKERLEDQQSNRYSPRRKDLETRRGSRRGDQEDLRSEESLLNPPSKDTSLRSESSLVNDELAAENIIPRKPNIFYKVFGSATDKIRNLGTPLATYVGNKLDKLDALTSQLQGKFRNRVQEILMQVDEPSRQRLDDYHLAKMLKEEPGFELTDKEQSVANQVREHLINIADENEAREIKKNPDYWPAIISHEVAQEWTQRPQSDKSKRFTTLLRDHIMEQMSGEDIATKTEAANEIIRNYKNALGGDTQSIKFGALRKVAGFGFPAEMQTHNILERFTRYGERVADDIAYNRVIEQDPIMMKALNVSDADGRRNYADDISLEDGTEVTNISSVNEVRNAMRFVNKSFREVHQPRLRAASRLVHSALLGAGTAIRQIAQIPLNTYPNVRLRNLPEYFRALGDMRKAWKESFQYNARQLRTNDIEFGSISTGDVIADWMNNLADVFRKYQGRELAEQFERAYEFSLGKAVALQEVGRALKGNRQAKEWVKKFGSTLELDDTVFSKESISDISNDTLSILAKDFVDRSSGTYSMRGLPAGTMEGNLAPFFTLSRWSIERLNIIAKDVVKPALKGDIEPLLVYTLGGYLTGEAIQEISKLLANSEPSEPELMEVVASEKQDPLQYARSIATVMQLGSFAGIASDMMKMSTDLLTGHKPSGGAIGFPLIDFVSETLAKGTADYVSAIRDGEDKIETTLNFAAWMALRTVQTARLFANNTQFPGLENIASKSNQERKKLVRSIRVFRELEGETVSSEFHSPNPFIDQDIKKFKRTEDLQEAVSMRGDLLQKQIERSEGDPEELKRGFRGLRQIPTTDFPNPEESPLEFSRYLRFLQDTKGEEEASKRLGDYFRRKAVNRVKKNLIPQIR